MKQLYMGTNTKMYKTIAQTTAFLKSLGQLTAGIPRSALRLFVIPSFTALQAAGPAAEAGGIMLGAQNMGWEDEGAFTGEVSPVMLSEVGVQVVEIGHSERRHVLGETDEMENKKTLKALKSGFYALLCIGETAGQKERRISDEVLGIQLKTALYGANAALCEKLWVAYEPVWAIGEGGVPATREYAQQRHAHIRKALSEAIGGAAAARVPLLYGGSVNPENAVGLIEMPDIDGLFIGRSAWDANRFNGIIRSVMNVHQS